MADTALSGSRCRDVDVDSAPVQARNSSGWNPSRWPSQVIPPASTLEHLIAGRQRRHGDGGHGGYERGNFGGPVHERMIGHGPSPHIRMGESGVSGGSPRLAARPETVAHQEGRRVAQRVVYSPRMAISIESRYRPWCAACRRKRAPRRFRSSACRRRTARRLGCWPNAL